MKKVLLFSLVIFLTTVKILAYDFQNGDLYYNVLPYRGAVEVASCVRGISGSVSIPKKVIHGGKTYNVARIGSHAFDGADRLTSISIPESITSIGQTAFWNCNGLTSITIPNSVTRIESNAFWDCKSLTSVIMSNSVTSIGSWAFYGCSSLKSYTFATDDIVSANEKDTVFFLNTSGWGDVYAYAWNSSESNEEWPGVPAQKLQYTYLGYEVYYFVADKGKFDYCIFNNSYEGGSQTDDLAWTSGMCYNNGNWISIEKHDLEAAVKIGASAFQSCVGLTAISIPECVKSIGEAAFQNCSNIETITIGSNVTDIGERAFSGCQSVYEITCKATKAPNVYESTFEDVSTLATLYVPAESIQKYKIHPVWSRFLEIVAIDESEENPNAIENTDQDGGISNNQKVIRNGQVVIIRDGKTYSVLGERIE